MRLSKPSCRRTIVSISARDASSSTTSTRPLVATSDGWVMRQVCQPSVRRRPAARQCDSVAVLLRLERAVDGDAEVGRLVTGEGGQPDTQRVEVQPGNLLVEVLGQDVDPDRVGL